MKATWSEKLTEDNFHAWKFKITNYLKGKGYWDYVEGANEAPPVTLDIGASVEQVTSLKDWHQGSAKVMYSMSISVSDSIVGHIQDANSPKDAWDNLIAFNATNTRARKIQLKNELNTIKKGDLSVNDYTLKIKALCESLSSIGVAVDDDDKHMSNIVSKTVSTMQNDNVWYVDSDLHSAAILQIRRFDAAGSGDCAVNNTFTIQGWKQIVSEKLTEDNFHVCKFRITNYLKGKGYWDYAEGANEAPPVIPDIGASTRIG
ncbi:hypothetical protein L7F22_066611 [Adiantum nelumboides]|nr:hypothetical protein [Adiantum nelumboides]